MLELYNSRRTAAGRQPVALNDALTRSAQGYADLLNRNNVRFANNATAWHTYGGTTAKQRIQAAGCPTPTTWGENIALGTLESGFNLWYGEGPGGGHYENIMKPAFRQIGVGISGRYIVVDHAAGCPATAAPEEQPARPPASTPPPAAQPSATAAPQPGAGGDVRQELLRLINEARAREGLPAMTLADPATTAAQRYAERVGATRVTRETDIHSVDGTQFGDRLRAAGCQWTTAAENIIAGQGGPRTAYEAMYGSPEEEGRGGWMNSPGHRANILNGAFRVLGFGYVANGSGTYDHVWVTEHADQC
jgi:uncharacterized protein YkwD